MAGFDLPSANFGQSLVGGLKTGQDWAVASQSLAIKKAELQRQQQSLVQQKAQHQVAIMQKVSDYMGTIATLPPAQRGKYFQVASKQAEMMGVDISAWKPLISDPTFQIDVAGPLAQMIQGTKNSDPKTIADSWVQFNAGMRDPVLARQTLASAMRSVTAQQLNSQKESFQASNTAQKADTKASDQGSKIVQDYQKRLATDQNYKKAVGQITQADQSSQLIEAAKQNPVANNAVPIQLARLFSGGQRMNAVEINKLGGSKAITDRLEQITKQMASGTLTDDNAKYMTDLVGLVKQGGEQQKQAVEMNVTKQYLQVPQNKARGLGFSDAFTELTGNPAPSIDAQKATSGTPSLTKDQLDTIKQGVQKFQSDGKSPEEIRNSIHAALGRDLSDDENASIGLGKAKPAAPITAPAPAPQMSQAPSSPDDLLNAAGPDITEDNSTPVAPAETDTPETPTTPDTSTEEEQ